MKPEQRKKKRTESIFRKRILAKLFTRGAQLSHDLARVISGRRCLGSSTTAALYSNLAVEPKHIVLEEEKNKTFVDF